MKRSCLWILTLTLGAAAPAVAADKTPADKPAAAAPAPKDPPKDSSKDPAKVGSPVSQADVDQYLTFFDKFVSYIEADQNDCDKMAKDLSAHLDASHALLLKAKTAHEAGKTLPESARQHIMATAPKMGPGVQKCNSNEKVMAALQKIPR